MTKKQKKCLIAKIMNLIKETVIALAVLILFCGMFLGAVLQESYRLNPPTEAERAEHPFITSLLTGEANERSPYTTYIDLPISPLVKKAGLGKPNGLCRVPALFKLRSAKWK